MSGVVMLLTVYTDEIEGQLKVSAESDDEALKFVQCMGFKIRSMIPEDEVESELTVKYELGDLYEK